MILTINMKGLSSMNMTSRQLAWTLCALSLITLPSFAHADRRSFVWNYEARTMAKGEKELEYYLTSSVNRPEGQDFDQLTFEHQVEIEYGVTDNFDVAMYQIFRQRETDAGADTFTWRGYKARARYRFGEIGQYFVDPLVYFEFIHKPAGDEIEFEEKLVLSKNIGHFILAFNGTLEQEIQYKADVKEYLYKPGLAAGYQAAPWVVIGAETEARFVSTDPGGYDHSAFFAGPTLSLAGESLWWNIGALFQVTDRYNEEPRYEVRSIVGLYF